MRIGGKERVEGVFSLTKGGPAMTIELNNDEIRLLRDVVEMRLKQLSVEIHRTEARDYRHALERIQERLVDIEERLVMAVAD